MNLSEKAKTGREICDSIMEFYKGLGATRLDGKLHISVEEFKRRELEEWVRFEYVQQQEKEHEEIRFALAQTCTNLNEQIGRLARERGELKQKLRTEVNEMLLGKPAVFAEETQYEKGYSKGYYDAKDRIKEILEELLK